MKINIGSKNYAKVEGVKEAFGLYFGNLIVKSIETESKVEKQPKTLGNITKGAINRAKKSFNNCDYSVGVESGIFPVRDALTNYMSVSFSAIYNGNKIVGTGLSPGFEHLPETVEKILNGNMEVSEIMGNKDVSKIKDIKNIGTIGLLSKGKYVRKDLVRNGTTMAIIQMMNN